jgi:hypothetical protein
MTSGRCLQRDDRTASSHTAIRRERQPFGCTVEGMSPVDENDKARNPQEQAAETRHQWELSHGHRRDDWPDPLREPYEPTQDELGLLHSQVPGHRWSGWRRLTGDEDYYAACSCGWRSTDTGFVSPMLRQVKEHLDAVWAIRGGRPPARATRAPARDEGEHGGGQRETGPGERARELHAAVENQQERLSRSLERSTNLLSASGEQADRLVGALEHAAAGIAPVWARTTASVRSAEVLQRRLERAKELRTGIVAAAAALTAMAEEVALVHHDPTTRHPRGAAEHRRLADQASTPAGEPDLAGLARATAAAGYAHRDQDLLDQVVNRLFQVGRSLDSAADLPHEAAMQQIADAQLRVDDTIREIRGRVLAARGHDGPVDPAPRNGPS